MTPEERVRLGEPAFQKLIRDFLFYEVLDIGAGHDLRHARRFQALGFYVTALDPRAPRVSEPGLTSRNVPFPRLSVNADCVWCCHCLEHQVNPGQFLRACARAVTLGGTLAVTVPATHPIEPHPARPNPHAIVSGHVTLWNAGLLLYNLVLAGFDCSEASVYSGGYDVSVIVRHRTIPAEKLERAEMLIERLAPYFPMPVEDGFDGRIERLNW